MFFLSFFNKKLHASSGGRSFFVSVLFFLPSSLLLFFPSQHLPRVAPEDERLHRREEESDERD